MTFQEIVTEIMKHENRQIETSLAVITDLHYFCMKAERRVNDLIAKGENPRKNEICRLDKEILLEALLIMESDNIEEN